MNVYRVRLAGRWAILAALCLALGIAASAAPPNTFVTPPDITPTSFWRIDYWDFNPSFSPTGQIAMAPVALNSYGKSAFSMIPGDGIGGAGCARQGGKVHFGTQDLDGVLLSSINTLSYSYLADELGSGATPTNLAPYVNIFIDRNSDGIWRGGNDTILIYEPIYTRGNGFVTVDTWYTDNIIGASATGNWHVAGQPITGVGQFSPAAPNDTWAEIMLVDLDGAGPGTMLVRDLPIVNPDPGCDDPGSLTSDEGTGSGLSFVVGQKSGDGWTGWQGFLDAIQLGVNPTALQDINITLSQSLNVTGGNGQSVVVGSTFSNNLTVRLVDTGGNGIAGETVSFSAPVSGASAALSSTTQITDVNGYASVSAVANLTAGSYNVTVNADGRQAVIGLTNTAPPVSTTQLVLPQNLQTPATDFWVVDYYDNTIAAPPSPLGELALNPTGADLTGFGSTSFNMLPGPGIGDPPPGGGCDRLGGKVYIGTTQLAGLSLRDLTRLKYSYMIDTPDSLNQLAPVVNIFVDRDNNGLFTGADTILVYEPIYTRGNGFVTVETWYSDLVIGVEDNGGLVTANGRWHTAAAAIPGLPGSGAGAPDSTVDTWAEIIATDVDGVPGGDRIGDLKIVNPTAGCDDAGPSSDEGTGSGFVISIGQKNGQGFANMSAFVEAIDLWTNGAAPTGPTVYDFALYGTPTTIAKTSGDNQSQDIGFLFDDPLTVVVTDASSNPVIGATVTFTAPGVGASAAVTASVVTDATGTASTNAIANMTAGDPYNVTAAMGALSTNFALTNTDPGAAVKTYVLPQDLDGIGDLWTIDYYDNDPVNSPNGQLAFNPAGIGAPLAGYGSSSFQMLTGPGLGGTGCARLGGKVFLGTQQLNGTALKDLKYLSYSFLLEDTDDFNYGVYINVFVDKNGDGLWVGSQDSILVYEAIKPGNTPGPVTMTANTWYEPVAIGPLSTGRWHSAAQTLGTISPNNPGAVDTWNEILAEPFAGPFGDTVGDLRVVNPTAGCDDAGPSSDEGTGSGLVIVIGQKNGASYSNADAHVDKMCIRDRYKA